MLRKGDWCLLIFKSISWETDLWVTQGDFALNSAKLGREVTKNQFSKNEICSAEDNHSCMSNMYANEFSDLKFISAVIDEISIFQKIAPNFTYSKQKNMYF